MKLRLRRNFQDAFHSGTHPLTGLTGFYRGGGLL
jgi:hypothetical protein